MNLETWRAEYHERRAATESKRLARRERFARRSTGNGNVARAIGEIGNGLMALGGLIVLVPILVVLCVVLYAILNSF